MGKKKKSKKDKSDNAEVWTEDQCEEYLMGLYGMEFIAGYTEGGAPYGIFKDDFEENGGIDRPETSRDLEDEIPF